MRDGMSMYLVPAILVAVALGQITCATRGGLTPWKGGGFGMFASIDAAPNRFLSITAARKGGRVYAVVVPFGRFSYPPALSGAFATRTLAFPTRRRLEEIAQAVAGAQLVEAARPIIMPTRLANSSFGALLDGRVSAERQLEVIGPVRVDGVVTTEVTVRVLRVEFDRSAATVMLVVLGDEVRVRRRTEPGNAQ